ncbi:MAG: 50S ribosomal protein L13 [Candidatus Altiarchaeota archaeon]|nr:50S ribosomal protein L13 [Candidatus Altiarchaeota archaeon]
MNRMIINAQNQTLGRMLSYAAKQALKGSEVIIINAEQAVITGKKEKIFNDYLAKLEIKNRGNYTRGPFHYKRPDLFVKKTLRGMLPFDKPRGVEAFKRIRIYIGEPESEIARFHKIDLKKEKPHNLEPRTHVGDYVTVSELCKFIGGSW